MQYYNRNPVYASSLNFPRYRYYYITALAVLENVVNIYKRMSHAAMRADRNPEEVTLIAVTKLVPAAKIKEAVDAGQRIFGESKVQEAAEKVEELKESWVAGGRCPFRWHMVGHLQKNKVKKAVEIFDLIHSVDSFELMKLINRQAADSGKIQRVLVQVNLAREESKFGVRADEVKGFLEAAEGMENLKIEGLMTIPPFFDDPEGSRPFYRRLKELAGNYGLKELSMGMTGDFEAAIEEGATMVRVGTAIFGERPVKVQRGYK